MQTVSISASVAEAVILQAPAGGAGLSKLPRYTIGITLRQERVIIAEARRRGIGFSEMVRRILDVYAEKKDAEVAR